MTVENRNEINERQLVSLFYEKKIRRGNIILIPRKEEKELVIEVTYDHDVIIDGHEVIGKIEVITRDSDKEKINPRTYYVNKSRWEKHYNTRELWDIHNEDHVGHNKLLMGVGL